METTLMWVISVFAFVISFIMIFKAMDSNSFILAFLGTMLLSVSIVQFSTLIALGNVWFFKISREGNILLGALYFLFSLFVGWIIQSPKREAKKKIKKELKKS